MRCCHIYYDLLYICYDNDNHVAAHKLAASFRPLYKQSKMKCRTTVLCLLQNHENEEEIKHVSKYKLRRAIFEEFNKLWQLQIPKLPKADTYRLFKTRVKFENYLIDTNNRKHRVAFKNEDILTTLKENTAKSKM